MGRVAEDLKVNGKWMKAYTSEGNKTHSFSGNRWAHMRSRCDPKGYIQAWKPTYIGCTMSESFKDFQFFTDWHVLQVGYGLEGYHLDKDLLYSGNKEYNEKSCVLIPTSLNNFVMVRSQDTRTLPLGVRGSNRPHGKYTTGHTVNGEYKHLGTYYTPEEAYSAYKDAKEEEARKWFLRLSDGEFIVDDRVIERMRTWTLEVPNVNKNLN